MQLRRKANTKEMTVWPGVKGEPIQFSKESCKRNTLEIYI